MNYSTRRCCKLFFCLYAMLACLHAFYPDNTYAKGGGPTFDGNMPGAGALKVPVYEGGAKNGSRSAPGSTSSPGKSEIELKNRKGDNGTRNTGLTDQ